MKYNLKILAIEFCTAGRAFWIIKRLFLFWFKNCFSFFLPKWLDLTSFIILLAQKEFFFNTEVPRQIFHGCCKKMAGVIKSKLPKNQKKKYLVLTDETKLTTFRFLDAVESPIPKKKHTQIFLDCTIFLYSDQ